MEFLKKEYSAVRTFCRDSYGGTLKTTAGAFVVLILIGFAGGVFLPELTESFIVRFTAHIDELGIVENDGTIHAAALFFNNIRATFYTVIYGLLPVVYLPALALGINSLILGALAARYVQQGVSLAIFFAGVLPHGIFELPALIVAISLGIYLCSKITYALRHKVKGIIMPAINQVMRTLILISLPLLLVASLIEAYVTPLLLNLF